MEKLKVLKKDGRYLIYYYKIPANLKSVKNGTVPIFQEKNKRK